MIPALPRREVDHRDAMLADLAWRDAMRHARLEIPDPEDFAQHLPLPVIVALKAAWCNGKEGWRVPTLKAITLRPYSLVEARGTHLSAFGIKVRKVIMRWDKEELA